MQHSSTASLWAGVSLPDPTQKKPVQPARNPASSVLRSDVPLDFVVAKQKQTTLEFGAFRSPELALWSDQSRTKIMSQAADLGTLPIPRAFESWLEFKSERNRASTINCYRDYILRLNTFFAKINEGRKEPLTLADVHIGHIEQYQRVNRQGYHAASINHDINALSQVMRRAGLWTPIHEHYRPLPLPETDPPKVMSEAEEDRFFEFAARKDNEESWLAYWVASLTNNSTASGKELRMLQLGSIDLEGDPFPYFQVPKNMKNPNRPRRIPLNERGVEIMGRILKRADKMGSSRPEHYLFPLRIKRNLFDPTKPASESWIRYRWKLLVDNARNTCAECDQEKSGCGCLKFKPILTFQLKPHNLRHQSITKMLDSGAPIEVVRQIAGHGVDSIVTRQYHHGRMEVMARALGAIDPDRKKPQPDFPQKRGKGVTA